MREPRHEQVADLPMGEWLDEALEGLTVPGVALAVRYAGYEQHVFRGITSVDNPLPIDGSTVFPWASITKTFTATAVMQLVERGLVDLDEPVTTYLPDLRLSDPVALAEVTVLHLLNHTAGWAGDLPFRPDRGTEPIAGFVGALARAPQLTRPGSVVTYNNASLILAGHLVERATGLSFAEAIRDQLLDPLGMINTFERAGDVMTRRFAVGHESVLDGAAVVGPWPAPQYAMPAGGLAGTSSDLLTWARFHLGCAGTSMEGVLGGTLRQAMQRPTARLRGAR